MDGYESIYQSVAGARSLAHERTASRTTRSRSATTTTSLPPTLHRRPAQARPQARRGVLRRRIGAGDFPAVPDSEFGFYVGGTRFLDRFDLRIHGQRPLVLNAAVSDDNLQVAIDLTNADVHDGDTVVMVRADAVTSPAGSPSMDGSSVKPCGSRLRDRGGAGSTSTGASGRISPTSSRFAGSSGSAVAVHLPPLVEGGDGTAALSRDWTAWSARAFSPSSRGRRSCRRARRCTGSSFPPGGRLEISVTVVALEIAEDGTEPLEPPEIVRRRREERAQRHDETTRIATAHGGLTGWLRRSRGDLHMLVTDTPEGSIPYAGIPWYVAAFGRDSLITALQMLPLRAADSAGYPAVPRPSPGHPRRSVHRPEPAAFSTSSAQARWRPVARSRSSRTTGRWTRRRCSSILLAEYLRLDGRPFPRRGAAAAPRPRSSRWILRTGTGRGLFDVCAPIAGGSGQPGMEGLPRRDHACLRRARRRAHRARGGAGVQVRRAPRGAEIAETLGRGERAPGCGTPRDAFESGSRRISGRRRRASTPWPWTARAGRAG